MRGIGYQNVATILNTVSYWIIVLPLAYILLFVYNFDFMGIWIADPIGSFILLISYILIIFTAPWKKLAKQASEESALSLVFKQDIRIRHHRLISKQSWSIIPLNELEGIRSLIELKKESFK